MTASEQCEITACNVNSFFISIGLMSILNLRWLKK